jgi:hypothetical protein
MSELKLALRLILKKDKFVKKDRNPPNILIAEN